MAAINTDMNGKIYMYGTLVQFGCYQHRYEYKGLWCSSTVWLLSTQTYTQVNEFKPHLLYIRLSLEVIHIYVDYKINSGHGCAVVIYMYM